MSTVENNDDIMGSGSEVLEEMKDPSAAAKRFADSWNGGIAKKGKVEEEVAEFIEHYKASVFGAGEGVDYLFKFSAAVITLPLASFGQAKIDEIVSPEGMGLDSVKQRLTSIRKNLHKEIKEASEAVYECSDPNRYVEIIGKAKFLASAYEALSRLCDTVGGNAKHAEQTLDKYLAVKRVDDFFGAQLEKYGSYPLFNNFVQSEEYKTYTLRNKGQDRRKRSLAMIRADLARCYGAHMTEEIAPLCKESSLPSARDIQRIDEDLKDRRVLDKLIAELGEYKADLDRALQALRKDVVEEQKQRNVQTIGVYFDCVKPAAPKKDHPDNSKRDQRLVHWNAERNGYFVGKTFDFENYATLTVERLDSYVREVASPQATEVAVTLAALKKAGYVASDAEAVVIVGECAWTKELRVSAPDDKVYFSQAAAETVLR